MSINIIGRRIILIVLILAAIAGGTKWVQLRMAHVYSDDARISADMIDIGSKVSGWIVSFPVSSGDLVKKGDVLVVIDSRDTVLKVQQLEAKASALTAGYEGQQAEIEMVERQTGGAYQAASSQLEGALASLSSATSELEFRASEWKRAKVLRKKKIISVRGYEAAQTQYRQASQSREASIANVANARAKLTEAEADQSQLIVMERNLAKLQFERESLQVELERQRVDLSDRKILAPSNGIIDGLFMDSGEHVLPGMRMLMMHNPEDVWVNANVKETEIRYLKVGQLVDISVDAYPDIEFTGRILKIGHAVTSEFSLLPSTNPSGNFTKVTQRLKVKIAVEQQEFLLKPGMMVEVAINVQ